MHATNTTTPTTEEPVCQDTEELISLMVSEVEAGRPGKRIRTETGEWIADPSTYPSWMGENGLTKKEILHAYKRYQQTGKKLRAYQVLEIIAEKAFEFGEYTSPFYGTIKLKEDTMTVTKSLEEYRKMQEQDSTYPTEEVEEQIYQPKCKKCGATFEEEEERIEITRVKGKEKVASLYHVGCYMSLPRVKSFQVNFTRPEPGKNPRVDVSLDGEAFLPSGKVRQEIARLCYMLENEYQNQRKDC